jgi:predicted Zn-dependent peptidase
MNKELVPYQPSVDLKELGFNMKTFAQYSTKIGDEWIISFNVYGEGQFTGNEGPCIAPTFSQAFRWFREKYGLVIQYIPSELDNSEGQSILHHQYKISEYDSWRGGRRNTVETELNEDYEEAELECLKKLIEIAKEKKNETK